jgi:hypothetical protein
MKTRDELVLEFMVALASNPAMTPAELHPKTIAEMIHEHAYELAFKYLENV